MKINLVQRAVIVFSDDVHEQLVYTSHPMSALDARNNLVKQRLQHRALVSDKLHQREVMA
jgi:hypothetical protein